MLRLTSLHLLHGIVATPTLVLTAVLSTMEVTYRYVTVTLEHSRWLKTIKTYYLVVSVGQKSCVAKLRTGEHSLLDRTPVRHPNLLPGPSSHFLIKSSFSKYPAKPFLSESPALISAHP